MINIDNSSLESQCDVTHDCCASLWNVADFGVAVAVGVAPALVNGRINPARSGIVQVEDVVDVETKNHLLDAFVLEVEHIVGRDVTGRETRQ